MTIHTKGGNAFKTIRIPIPVILLIALTGLYLIIGNSEESAGYRMHRLKYTVSHTDTGESYSASMTGISMNAIDALIERVREKRKSDEPEEFRNVELLFSRIRVTINGLLYIDSLSPRPLPYYFSIAAHHGARLMIDNRLVCESIKTRRKRGNNKPIILPPGLHRFSIDYTPAHHKGFLELSWKRGSQGRWEAVPTANLFAPQALEAKPQEITKAFNGFQLAEGKRNLGKVCVFFSGALLLFTLLQLFRPVRLAAHVSQAPVEKIKRIPGRIGAIDVTKGFAGFLMILAHIKGGDLLPFGTFGAALFFFCSGMNTILFLQKTTTMPGGNWYHPLFAFILFAGGYTQIKIAHPSQTGFVPEFLQFSALAVLMVFLLFKLINRPKTIGFLFPLPFIIHLLHHWELFSTASWPVNLKYFLLSPGGFSLFPWSGYFLLGILLLTLKDHPKFPNRFLVVSGCAASISIWILKIPVEKFNMSLSYILLSIFVLSLIFRCFNLLDLYFKTKRTKGTIPVERLLNGLAIAGRNSLMLVYVHYVAIYYFKLSGMLVSPYFTLLIRTLVYFLITLLILYLYDQVKRDLNFFYPMAVAGFAMIFIRYTGLLDPRMDVRLVDIGIGIIFAFVYVQLRDILRRYLKQKEPI